MSSEDAFTELLDRLDGVHLRGGDAADARCPAHPDGKASLSVSRGGAGRILITCHAGCDWRDVLRAVGMTVNDAFGEPRVVREHIYVDADSNPLYVVERWEPKTFKQRMVSGARRSPRNDERVIYNLAAVTAAKAAGIRSLFYVEGEHDVDVLAEQGYLATTTLGGANKPWLSQYTEALAGFRVVIVADNDEPGLKWARQVARHLHPYATSVLMVPPKDIKDIGELIEAGYPITALRPLPDSIGEVVSASDIPIKQVEWLWKGRLPLGMLTLLEGDPGTGKSTISLEVVACLTSGRPLPGESKGTAPLRVAMLADEDSWSAVVVPRLTSAGADLARVLHLRGIRGDDGFLQPYSLADLSTLRHDLDKVHADLLVIDPLMAYLGNSHGTDSYRDQDVRAVLGPLVQMAEEDRRTIIAVRHFTKGSGAKAIHKGGGSIGFTGQARCILQTGKHPEDEDAYVLAVTKPNLGPLAASLAYAIGVDQRLEVGYIRWQGAVGFTAQQIADGPKPDKPVRQTAQASAAEWLVDHLSDGKAKPWLEIEAAGIEGGYTAITLRRAREDVLTKHAGPGGNRDATWSVRRELSRHLKLVPNAGNEHLIKPDSGDDHLLNRPFAHPGPESPLAQPPGEDLNKCSEPSESGASEGLTEPHLITPGDIQGPDQTGTHLINPLLHLPDEQVGQVGQPDPALGCTVCGGLEALVEYPEVGYRCALHSPLIYHHDDSPEDGS